MRGGAEQTAEQHGACTHPLPTLLLLLCGCNRKLEEVLVLKQSRLLALIREGNRLEAAAAARLEPAKTPQPQQAAARGLKRSRSTAWSSETLHAVSSIDAEQQTARAAD